MINRMARTCKENWGRMTTYFKDEKMLAFGRYHGASAYLWRKSWSKSLVRSCGMCTSIKNVDEGQKGVLES